MATAHLETQQILQGIWLGQLWFQILMHEDKRQRDAQSAPRTHNYSLFAHVFLRDHSTSASFWTIVANPAISEIACPRIA